METRAPWDEFSSDAWHSMTKFKHHELDLTEACRFTDKYREAGEIDEEILEFVENVIASIIPDVEMFDEVVRLFKAGVSEEEFLRYMNSP